MILSFDSGNLGNFEKTPEGFLKAPVIMSRVGVMDYGINGKKAKLPEELFSDSTIKSFEGMPITDEHPQIDGKYIYLDADNYGAFTKGNVSNVKRDGNFLKGMATIFDKDLGNKILTGEQREVSIGYDKRDDHSPGEFDGENYDIVQRNIRGNHLAVTEVGRAGSLVKIEVDAIGKIKQDKVMKKIKYVKIEVDSEGNEKVVTTDTLTYRHTDGNDIQVDADIKKELVALKEKAEPNTKLQTEFDSLKKENEELKKKAPEVDTKTKTLETELAAEKALNATLQKTIDGHKGEFDSAVTTGIKSRIKLEKNAKLLEVDTADKSDKAIKKEIISKNIDIDAEDLKTDVEIDAYYKAALKVVNKKATEEGGLRESDNEFEVDSDNWSARDKALADLEKEDKS